MLSLQSWGVRKCVLDPVLLFVIVENCKVDSGVELIAFLKVCHDKALGQNRF